MARHQKRSLVVAAICGLAGLIGAFVAWYLLGAITGVVAICPWAPEWWAFIYFGLAITIPIIAIWVAIKSRRSYLRRVLFRAFRERHEGNRA